MTLTVGSLFAGIGGFDLGFERCGMRTVWQVEQNDFCRAVLARHFPDAERFVDVRDVGVANLAPVDLICGGFPCQDISLAGKGAGIDGARSGLWAEFARIIGELGSRYVVVENVPAIRSRGLDRVLRDLAALGYDAEWDCLPASALGAPHQRDRFWLVAYPNADGDALRADLTPRDGWEVRAALGGVTAAPHGVADPSRHAEAGPAPATGAERERVGPSGQRSGAGSLADSDGRGGDRLHEWIQPGRLEADAGGSGEAGPERAATRHHGGEAPGDDARGSAGSGRRGTGDVPDAEGQPERAGLRSHEPRGQRRRRPGDGGGEEGTWSVEPDVGRVADGVPARMDRLSALGNALVPQIAEWIGQRILDFEQSNERPL